MNSNMDKDVSARIASLRYPLLYLIVVIHVPWLTRFSAEPGITSFIGEFFNNGIVRVSIPTLTCISAYLIFSMKLDQDFKLLIRKRASALLVPMIVWNLPLVIFLYVIQNWNLKRWDAYAVPIGGALVLICAMVVLLLAKHFPALLSLLLGGRR
jgi:fucose 4-O-acetylase-like acetyltransferase